MEDKMKLKVFYFAVSIVILLNGSIHSQPYQNYLVKRYVDTTDISNKTIYKIVGVNLKTGEEDIILNKTAADVFFTDPTCNWILTGKHRDGFKVYNVLDTNKTISIPYGVIPNTIRYSKLRNKIYIFGDNYPSDSNNTKSLVAFNIATNTFENTITLPFLTLDDSEPFFSTDENKLYVTIEDSVGIEFNDKSHTVIYSTLTNNIINNVELKNLGYPNAGYYTVQREEKEKE